MGAPVIDMTGRVFTRLTVLRRSDAKLTPGYATWITRCECGKEHTVAGIYLRSGATKSCGCLAKENRETGRLGDLGRAAKALKPRKPARPRKPRLIPRELWKQRPLRALPPNLKAAHDIARGRAVRAVGPGRFPLRGGINNGTPRPKGKRAGAAGASLFGAPEVLQARRRELALLMQLATREYCLRNANREVADGWDDEDLVLAEKALEDLRCGSDSGGNLDMAAA